ncbi:MAG: hypothetical protein AAGE18_06915 [Pseudomonadota bacterium]
MSLLRPAYRVTIGGQQVDSAGAPLANTLTAIDVQLDMDAMAADQATLFAGQVGAFAPEVGDEVVIALGYADEDQEVVEVMRGTVAEVRPDVTAERIVCLNAASRLARQRMAQAFRDSRAEDIVQTMAAEANVTVARTGQSELLPYYVIDPGKSLLRHMADLAALTGFDLYLTHDDELVFEPFGAGREVLPLAYATDILAFEVNERPPAHAMVEVYGEGPGAGQGAESWSWLTKDFAPRKGSAGQGTPTLLLERPVARTAELAQMVADAAETRFRRKALTGAVVILGRPSLRLGDAIRLSEMPDAALNATFQVRALRHRIDKRTGFVTDVAFQSIGGLT